MVTVKVELEVTEEELAITVTTYVPALLLRTGAGVVVPELPLQPLSVMTEAAAKTSKARVGQERRRGT